MFHSSYKGVNIWKGENPGFALPYTALINDIPKQVASDTLQGIKDIITEELNKLNNH